MDCANNKALLGKCFALWKIRSEMVHGTDEKATYKLKVEQYRTIIQTIFHLQDSL